MSKYYLFLDDKRNPEDVHWVNLPKPENWVIARDYWEFIRIIVNRGLPAFIAYDCDLCDEHYEAYFNLRDSYPLHYKKFKTKCGIHCIDWLLGYCNQKGVAHPPFIMHTQNKYAINFMKHLVDDFNGED